MNRNKKRGLDLLDVMVITAMVLILVTTIMTIVVSLQICDLMKEINQIKEETRTEQTTATPQSSRGLTAQREVLTLAYPSPPTETPTPSSEATPEPLASEEEIVALSKCVWGEGRGVSVEEMKMIVHTVINRTNDPEFPDTIVEVLEDGKVRTNGNLEGKGQFHGYLEENPVTDEIREVVMQALQEPEPVNQYSYNQGGYIYFSGDGTHNWFRR